MVKFPKNLIRKRPVVVEDYNLNWPFLYEKEKRDILTKLGSSALDIEHIGGTSLPGIAAKPIIDIIVRMDNLETARKSIPPIESINYKYLPEIEKVFTDRVFFWKGTKEIHTVHLILMEKTSPAWDGLIAFREYLKKHPKDAKNYETLKRELAEKFSFDPISYANGKEEFVVSIDKKIKMEKQIN
ncbi:GrpB family protein [Thermodesulfobacteriota bacterium]